MGQAGILSDTSMRWRRAALPTQTHRRRDTETPRHRDTETQRHRDTETQRHRDTETQRRRDTETHNTSKVLQEVSLLLFLGERGAAQLVTAAAPAPKAPYSQQLPAPRDAASTRATAGPPATPKLICFGTASRQRP